MTKFSFVLPAFKGEFIRDSINSILSQFYTDFELIIVDDCSPDHIDEIVNDFSDKRISFYRNTENIGAKDLVAQWNHCLEFAKGDYVILATDDDLYEPHFLSSFVPLVEKYPDVNLFRARVLQVDSQNNIKSIDKCYKEYLNEVEFRYYMMHGIRGGIPHYIFKRNELINKGGFVNFPVAWGADDATAMLMAVNGVVNSQEHLVRFRWSDINISSDHLHFCIDKLHARLQLIRWMSAHPVKINQNDEWYDFYAREIIQFSSAYYKSLIITRMTGIPKRLWPCALNIIIKSNLFTIKDICSIAYRAIRK